MTTNQWRIGRDQVIKVLAGSLTPATLAQVIADLGANDQNSDHEQQIADHAQSKFLTQLECMVGDDDARCLVMEAQEPPKASPCGPQKIMTVLCAQPQ
jgi:capsular polysaccharide biosynthesis protein